MSLLSKNQLKLYGLEDYLNELINLYDDKKLPNKILLSGQKGIGKCTLAYHLINYILSKDEEFPYDLNSSSINRENRSYKLIQNGSNMNFALIDILTDKKNIDISQIRDLILILNKSSFNTKSRIVLIDNIEFLNINSVNALL
jgi:DNA polymerase-3 subunit delta'